jgi:phosphatidylglycerophosphatase A
VTRTLTIFVASGAYTGYAPIAPGTAGAALGAILGYLVCAPLWRRWPVAFIVVFAIIFVVGCVIAGDAETLFDEHDSSHIVLDEVLGMIAAMFMLPTGWIWIIAAFVVFRIFDIIKPWPASRFDRVESGAGVMLDDLAAGIYANLVLQVVRLIL